MKTTESPSPSGKGLGWGRPVEKNLLARAKAMRRAPTEWEMRPWRHLSNSQLAGYKLRRQAVIGSYICDFFCPAKALAVEIDGDTHNENQDARRDRVLARRGVEVVRFTNRDIVSNMNGVLQAILVALQTQPDRWTGGLPRPNPSPGGEGLL